MAWTISRLLGLCAGVGVHAAGSETTHRQLLLHTSTVTWYHSNTHTRQGHRLAKPHTCCQVSHCHVHACCSRCCELVDSHTLLMHRSRVPIRRQFSLPAYTRVTNFWPREWGSAYTRDGLYASIYGSSKRCGPNIAKFGQDIEKLSNHNEQILDLKAELNDFWLYKINSIITYSLASRFMKKCFEKYLLAFISCFWHRKILGRTSREPPRQNLEVRYDVIAV